jgi:creatinine amidohydrolase
MASRVAAVMWAQLAAEEIAARVESASYGHACEVETSVVMALVSDRLFSDRIAEPKGRRSLDPLTDPPGAVVDQAVWMEEWTDDGALGDPRLASIEFGHTVVEIAYRRMIEFTRAFAEAPLLPQEES